MEKNYSLTCKRNPCQEIRYFLARFMKATFMVFIMLLTVTGVHAQYWDATSSNGTTGSNDYGNGVYRLLSDVNTGCAGASVSETTDLYDPAAGNFNKCYQLFFGCPGNDNIGAGTDANGDGMAFSFSKGAFSLVGNSCGGGLGYMEARADTKMITIEFDTYSSMGGSGFDANYGGGTTGNNDEISLHFDAQAGDVGLIEPLPGMGGIVDAGNLEDGLEHTVCINYNNTTHILSVTIDGVSKLSYDLDLKGKDFVTYFGAGGLTQSWSSGKFGATNPSTVAHNLSPVTIATQLGGVPLCPAGVEITSPSNGANVGGCPVGPVTITATATPPASTTVVRVEFFVDGSFIGQDLTAPHSFTWSTPTNGNHVLTCVAYYSNTTNSSSLPVNINVGGVQKTSTPPVIGGPIDAIWASYSNATVPNLSGTLNSGVNDLAATYKITYDATYLYVLVDVTDDIIHTTDGADWERDGVEVFIDRGNEKIGCCTYDANDYQYTFVQNGTINGNGKPTTGITSSSVLKAAPAGYITEIRIPWSTIVGGFPSPGTYIGFDIGVNDDDDGGTRDNQLTWNNGGFLQWQNPSRFGTVQFTDCDPLPVSLLSFTGKMANGIVILNWSTAVEVNNNKFIVERSTDLYNWQSIGEVAGAGNFNSIVNYSFTDYAPLNGITYYRLRQVDTDGTYAYSNAIVVQTGLSVNVNISPNPFDDVLTIQTNSQDEIEISIHDVLGRLLYTARRKSENGLLTLQPDLASGAYVITVQTEAFVERQKVIKK